MSGDVRIAFVQACWHREIVDQARDAFLSSTAIVAAAFVVDGGIYRHEFVAGTVLDALMRVQLDTDVPVLSAVLTPESYRNQEAHRPFFRDHFKVRGEEVAQACARTIENLASIPGRIADTSCDS